ncbi:MAG TPA: hypothetical protein VGT44_14265, partial [Ktedonobacteraceae bacterium]|nr:hypothetical protein [Ktedonobacteraceae bacterium]
MAERSMSEQTPFETWSKLIENTMKDNPALQRNSGQAVESGKDPWITLIDKLWQANPSSKLLPIDPAEITHAFQQIWTDALRHPDRTWANYADFVQSYTQMMTGAALKFWGQGKDVEPTVSPEKGDKRFSTPDWQQNPAFDALKQSYLLASTTLLKSAAEVQGLDEHQQRKL